MTTVTRVTACLLFLGTFLLPVTIAEPGTAGRDRVTDRVYDDAGRLVAELGVRTDDEAIAFVRSYKYADDKEANGNGRVASSSEAATDCRSTKYATAGWRWTTPYSAFADQHASLFSQAGNAWDAETGASIFGGVQSGVRGTGGQMHGVNQIQFVSLGASTTIAVTTTWYYRGSGQAVESDGQYNTYYAWSTSGAAGAMDVLNIATHEVGHTFGLNHPKGPGVSCLTMYAYANAGETQKRTLGDGDILGIEAIYGA